MSISTVNAFYKGTSAGGGDNSQFPTVTGEILAGAAGSGDLFGFALPVLDGSATTFTLNFIDGTAKLAQAPAGILLSRNDPPAWKAATQYPKNAIVLGTGHVQQATTGGTSAAAAPTWKTDGTSVTETAGPTWKDLGAIALSTIQPVSAITITDVSALITLSAAGTSTQVPVVTFHIVR